MAYEHLCMYCFEDLQGQAVCPHCGRDSRAAVPQIQMLPGTLVYHDRFVVGRALGQDATGIVYSAYDTKRENKMRLREYLPRDCAERLNDGSVVPTAGLEDQFEKGMRKLRASVEGVEDPKKRHFYFEENGTAYIAQRKTAAAAAAVGAAADEDTGSGFKQIGVIVGIAAAVVVVAAIVIVSLVNGALNSSNDVVQNATLAPHSTTNLWAPEVTASPTPYVSPTFAALVDPEQSWMDYTYSGDVNKEFQNQLNQSATATPKPSLGDSDDDDYKTVNKNSSTAAITTLQQRLASLGWLSAEKITGKYDSATKQAVKDFQTYVNNTFQPAEKLSVDGVAGPKTQQWLYATEAVKPTPTPTPAVTADPNEGTVDKDSSKTDIKAVQRKLIVLGLMSAGSDDGVYGTTTTAAVKKFQQRVNQLQGYEALEVTGVVDPDTMAYLNYYVEWWESLQQATATPEPVLPTTPAPTGTPAPTDAPDKEEDGFHVDKDSPKESIRYVQQMLIEAGLLPAGSDDGDYGAATATAMLRFQQYVNDYFQGDVLPEDGVGDSLTLSYLEEFVSRGMTVPKDEPTAPPTPTDAPRVELSLSVGGTELMNGVHAVTGDSVTFNWSATGAVSDYYIYVYKQNGDVFYQNEATDRTSGSFGADSLNPGEVYTISIGALPEGGDESDMVWTEAQFGVPAADPTATPEPDPTATPEPAPTDEPVQDDGSITPDSSADDVRYMQNLLISAGVLKDGSADGDYGNGTANAVLKFQQYVNDYFGDAVLDETGIADANTMKYLEEFVNRGMTVPSDEPTAAPEPDPTATPEPAPTEEPVQDDGSITPDSSADDVRYMQQLLISAGVLKDGSADGDYGNGTAKAVQKFQQYVNDYFGDAVLDETGIADANTMKYLEEFVNRGMTVPSDEPTAAPEPDPTATPEPAPTDEPVQDDGSITPDSSADDVRYMQNLLISAGVLKDGSADGDYGNGTKNAVLKFQQYVNDYFGDAVLDETGIADANTMKYLEEFVNRGMTVPSDEPTAAPEPDPTATPEPDPTDEPEPDPTDAPEPTKPPIPVIAINDVEYDEEIPAIDVSVPTLFSWTCEGDVQGFMLYMTNSAGQKRELDKTRESFVELDMSSLPADTYSLFVGAVPSDATSESDVVWSSIMFTIG